MKPPPGQFDVTARDARCAARRGRLQTAHGLVETPVFMPVGTQAAVKTLSPQELGDLRVQIILANTYHLCVRPGVEIIARCGGLHRFMGWSGPILTDSGGYQVFSLAKLRQVREDGVEFNNHFDGGRIFLGPVEAMAIQRGLGSDIAMVFDECAPYPCDFDYACQSVAKSLAWAAQCQEQPRAPGQLVFGIVQGSEYAGLRAKCARELVKMGFDGYAIGGVSVGEPADVLIRGIEDSVCELPADRPRYLMGVGEPWQIVEAVARGIDMFDCVMPTRIARNGSAFTRAGRYPLKAGRYRDDMAPIERGCSCYACRHFTRAYIRHLLNVNEVLGIRLLTLHNVHRFMEMMREIREAIANGEFENMRAAMQARRQETGETVC